MTKITQTDYETVEKEVERYQCDHCELIFDRDDINDVKIHDGESSNTKQKHLCDGCTNITEAFQFERKRATVKDRWESFAKSLTAKPVYLLTGVVLGIGALWFAATAKPNDQASTAFMIESMVVGLIFSTIALGGWTLVVLMFGDEL